MSNAHLAGVAIVVPTADASDEQLNNYVQLSPDSDPLTSNGLNTAGTLIAADDFRSNFYQPGIKKGDL
jgi:hypothetical protein